MRTKTTSMPKLALLAATLLAGMPSTTAHAQNESHRFHDGGGDRKGDYLRFGLESTKAGLITTDVEGHVSEFVLSYELDDFQVRDINLSFLARHMQTGSRGRDDKMWSYCLDAEHHPRIEVQIPGPLGPTPKGPVKARMNVRGKWHPIVVELSTTRSSSRTLVRGRAKVSLSELGIPDPSIWVAKVDDQVEIDFRITFTVDDPTA